MLVSNLGGITGTLLGVDDGALAARLHLDVLYPVRGLKRCLDARNGFGKSTSHNCLSSAALLLRPLTLNRL